jgi:hypothetical protein
MDAYRRLTLLMAGTMAVLGVAMLVVTAANGGGQVGYVLGVVFVAAGLGRLYLLRQR